MRQGCLDASIASGHLDMHRGIEACIKVCVEASSRFSVEASRPGLSHGHPGLGQLQAKGHVSAAAASLESPTSNPIPVEGAPAACRASSKDYKVRKRSPLTAVRLSA